MHLGSYSATFVRVAHQARASPSRDDRLRYSPCQGFSRFLVDTGKVVHCEHFSQGFFHLQFAFQALLLQQVHPRHSASPYKEGGLFSVTYLGSGA